MGEFGRDVDSGELYNSLGDGGSGMMTTPYNTHSVEFEYLLASYMRTLLGELIAVDVLTVPGGCDGVALYIEICDPLREGWWNVGGRNGTFWFMLWEHRLEDVGERGWPVNLLSSTDSGVPYDGSMGIAAVWNLATLFAKTVQAYDNEVQSMYDRAEEDWDIEEQEWKYAGLLN